MWRATTTYTVHILQIRVSRVEIIKSGQRSAENEAPRVRDAHTPPYVKMKLKSPYISIRACAK